MANVQIPNLPAVAALSGAELFEGVQAGTSVKISLDQVIAAARITTPITFPFSVSVGGTGVSTITGYVKGSGTTPFTGSATIPNTDITGLGTMSTQDASSVTITGGSITGITDLAVADGGTGASTLTGYVKGSGTTPLTASATIPSTDITGLGTMSTQNANAVAITGGSINGTAIGASSASTIAGTTGTFTGIVSVTVSSASDAVRITQTGAGNAILVEDSANPDSTPFVVTATGDVGIGVASPPVKLAIAGDGSQAVVYRSDNTRYAALGDTGATDDGGVFLYDSAGALQSLIRAQSNSYVQGGNFGIGKNNPAVALDVVGSVASTGSILSSGTGGIGYATGAGAAVTQTISRTTTTPTTGASPTGAITVFTATAVVGTYFSFTVPNTGIAVTDNVILTVRGGTNTYVANCSQITAGTSFRVTMVSVAGTASDTPLVNYTIIKGVSA